MRHTAFPEATRAGKSARACISVGVNYFQHLQAGARSGKAGLGDHACLGPSSMEKGFTSALDMPDTMTARCVPSGGCAAQPS